MNALEIIFVFLFVDLFDNIGTLVAVTERAGPDRRRPHDSAARQDILRRCDGDGRSGRIAGTSTVTSYIESSRGRGRGRPHGRYGHYVTGLLFFASRCSWAPLVGAIPDFATAPALILVGALMVAGAARIDWEEPARGHTERS